MMIIKNNKILHSNKKMHEMLGEEDLSVFYFFLYFFLE